MAVPELQLSPSWVDFGTCFVNQARVREVYLMNLSGCRSYWAVLMGRLYMPTVSPEGWHHLGVPALETMPIPKSQVTPGLPCPVALMGTFPGQHMSCLCFLWCRSAGARRRPWGLQGISKQWAAGSTTGQRTPKYHHPPSFLHCQVPASPSPAHRLEPLAGAPFLTSAPPLPIGAVSCTSPRWQWKVCLVRRLAPCGSEAKALMTRDTCHPTSSEALPSAPSFGNKT